MTARGRLCRRCGLAEEDADLEALLNAAEGLCRACALEMFRYGRQLAPEREKIALYTPGPFVL